MHLVIGGAYQGKLKYAMERFAFGEDEVFDMRDSDPVPGYRCYIHLEALSRRHEDCSEFLPCFENAVVISREVGCGVVPTDGFDRLWRERHGVLLKKTAASAKSVTRVFCGIGEDMK